MRSIVIVLSGALLACGSDPGDEPVPATPLAGTLNGVPWMAGTAVARNTSDEGEKTVHMYPDVGGTCQSFGQDPYVAAVLPWIVGAQPLGLDADATVFIFMESTAHLVLDGRIEVLDAATEVGAAVPFRIRAVFEDSDDDLFVEGEIQVQICE